MLAARQRLCVRQSVRTGPPAFAGVTDRVRQLTDAHAAALWQTLPNQMKQLALEIPQWGGKRKRAGRKRQAERRRVSHKSRPRFDRAAAVLVTLRVASDVWNLRSKRCFGVIEDCFAGARARFGLRIIEFAVLGNHLHLLVEADSDLSLSRGMQGLGVRIAKALNRVMQRRGRVFDDHYHASLLATPTKLVNAIAYVLGNHERHYGRSHGVDPYSSLASDSARVLCAATTWLVRTGWRRSRAKSPWLDRWVAARHGAPAQEVRCAA
jgi:putative transposase